MSTVKSKMNKVTRHRQKREAKIPPEVVPKGDCNNSRLDAKCYVHGGTQGEVIKMLEKSKISCPKLYECSKIRMTPMIRAFLRCSVDDAMNFICANCDEKLAKQVVKPRERIPVAKRS